MSDRIPCEAMNDADRWAEWMSDGLPEGLIQHAQTCDRCAALHDELDRMKLGLSATADDLRASVESIDLRADVLAAIDEEPVAAVAGSGGWRGAAVAAVVAIAASLSLWFVPSPSMQISAPQGVISWTDGRRVITGVEQVSLPIDLQTEDAQAVLRDGTFEVRMQPHSRLVVRADDDLSLSSGGIALSSQDRAVVLNVSGIRFEGTGTFDIGRGERAMRFVNKHTAAASVVAAVLVYSGWARLEAETTSVEQKAPGGLLVDSQGNVKGFDLKPGAGRSGPGLNPSAATTKAAALRAAQAAGDGDTAEDEPTKTGAYWSDDNKAMLFAVAGEVFDAVSGEPVTDFSVRAVATKALGYGAAGSRSFTFSEQADGKFRLDALSLGTWRVTVRAEGYAAATQTVDLSGVGSDPYVVAPLSSGARLSGLVVDFRGKPLGGARVGLDACFGRGKAKAGCKIVKTSDDGRFTLDTVPAGEVIAVRAEHDRHGVAVKHGLRRAEGETEHVTIQLSGILRVFGQVTRGKDKTPAAGITVLSSNDDVQTVTDKEGRYTLFLPRKSRAHVWVETKSSDGFRSLFASYPERRSSDVIKWTDAKTHVAALEKNFRLGVESARLFGRITGVDGQPVADVELQLSNSTGWFRGGRGHDTFPTATWTNSDGRYAIDNVPHQAGYRVSYKSADDRWHDLGYVNVKDEAALEADFRLGEARIRGRFVDAATGEPFSASSRTCQRIGARLVGGGSHYANPRCYEDGRFEFSRLSPGRYVIENRIEWMASPVKIESIEVVVEAGGIAEGVTIAAAGEGSDTWQFRMTDSNGRFLPGVHVRYNQAKTSFTSNLKVGSNGVARLSLNRRYKKVFIDAPGHVSEEINLAGRSSDAIVIIELRRSAD